MDFSTAVQETRSEWRNIMPQITEPAKQKVNGETSWICPLCGHGTHGDGLTRNPQSNDGNGLKCFGCDFSGDIIDLYMRTSGKDFAEAVTELAGIAGITIEDSNTPGLNRSQSRFNQNIAPGSIKPHPGQETQEKAVQAADFTEYYKACTDCLLGPDGDPGREYLKGRQVLDAALYNGAGYDKNTKRIIIPCSNSFYIARSIDPEEKIRYLNPKGIPAAIFNEKALHTQEVQEVFITEGAIDALSIIQAGGQAIGLNSTSNARALIEKLEKTGTDATIILALDNDRQGQKATQEVQEALQRLQIPFITADICNGLKDPNSAIQEDYTAFYDAVQTAITDARAYKNKQQQEQERRTGPGMIDAFLEAVKTRKYEPVPTGITDIDRAIGGGFIRQQLVILGAAPGTGKTALAQWIFEGMAKAGRTILFLNLEMSREQILARSLSRIAKQNGEKIRVTDILQGYKWEWDQEATILNAAEQYKQEIAPHMIYNPEEVTADLDSILAYMDREAKQAEAAGREAPLVCIDYLQIIRGREREDDTAVIKRAVSSLKKYAIDHNTVVFLIQAHNRAANQSGSVTMESGRDTSAIEYSADLQLGLAYTRCLDRPGYDKKAPEKLTPEEKQLVTLKVTKGRFTAPGIEVDLHFNGETMTYTQLTDQEEPAPQRAGYRYR